MVDGLWVPAFAGMTGMISEFCTSLFSDLYLTTQLVSSIVPAKLNLESFQTFRNFTNLAF